SQTVGDTSPGLSQINPGTSISNFNFQSRIPADVEKGNINGDVDALNEKVTKEHNNLLRILRDQNQQVTLKFSEQDRKISAIQVGQSNLERSMRDLQRRVNQLEFRGGGQTGHTQAMGGGFFGGGAGNG